MELQINYSLLLIAPFDFNTSYPTEKAYKEDEYEINRFSLESVPTCRNLDNSSVPRSGSYDISELLVSVFSLVSTSSLIQPTVILERESFNLWRVAANILKKHSRTADKGWSSRLGVGREANNSSP
jgi:hypothetical protein